MSEVATEDARMALFVLRQLRFTLAQAKGYIGRVSEERGDRGSEIVREIEERLSEVEALSERFHSSAYGQRSERPA